MSCFKTILENITEYNVPGLAAMYNIVLKDFGEHC